MVSALRAVDSVFKLHVFHATAKTAYLKSIKLKVTDGQSTHLTNPVVISYKMYCCRMPRLSNDERNRAVTMLLQGATEQEVATALGVHQTTVHRLQGVLYSLETLTIDHGAAVHVSQLPDKTAL
jgi:DNA invertase Pin-like site-specific DNA recombinase